MRLIRRVLRWLLARLERPISRQDLERMRAESRVRIARGLQQSRELAEELQRGQKQ